MVEEDLSPTLDTVLAQALEESSAASQQDALLVALHSSLLSAGFVCVTSGDEVLNQDYNKVSYHFMSLLQGFGDGAVIVGEALSTPCKPGLPIGWNTSQEACSLQYRHNATGQKCLMKAIPLGDQLLISAVVGSGVWGHFSHNADVFRWPVTQRDPLLL